MFFNSEPPWLYRLVMAHFGGGDALFFGCLLLLIAAVGDGREWRSSTIGTLSRLGVVWIVLSGWPDLWLQATLFSFVIAWMLVRRDPQPPPTVEERRNAQSAGPPSPWPRRLRRCVMLLTVGSMICEWPYRWLPTIPIAPKESVSVVGDSITAGLNEGETTWPELLTDQTGLVMLDVSQPGATLRSAQQQLDSLDGQGSVLILEIGGNDLLENYPADRFERDLDELLSRARRSYRKIILFELPLPPLRNYYGYIQRRLAARYGIPLVPKSRFVGILTSEGGTVDGIHLSKFGQERMADLVQSLLVVPAAAE